MQLKTVKTLTVTVALIFTVFSRAAENAEPKFTPEGIEFFEKKIRPVLVESCYSCHSVKAEKLKGNLYLDSRAAMLKGGDSGKPSIVPGDLEKSLVIKAIRYKDDDLLMPPKKRLTAEQVADFETWVKMGAPDPRSGDSAQLAVEGMFDKAKKHWAFQPVKMPAIPEVKQKDWPKTPIDNFVLAKLEQKNLKPSTIADKRTLLRRVTFDLTGLPPKPEDYAAFEADTSPDAYTKLIDRLLASPQYGERWARYWLDLARYADTKGYVFEEERRYPYSYTYRDWVIRSLNEDLPYDQFLIQQIAADQLQLKEDKRPLAAMGFMTLGRRFLNNQADIIDDRIDVLSRGTQALTVGCARCHDHKFDPIPTKDYYSLYAVFASSREPKDPPMISMGEKTEQNLAYERELAAKQKKVDEFKEKKFAEHVASVNKPEMRAQCLALAQETLKQDHNESKKTAEAKKVDPFGVAYFRKKLKENKDAATLKDEVVNMTFEDALKFLGNDEDLFNGDDKKKIRDLVKEVDAVKVTHPGAPARAMVLEDADKPVVQHVFKRGNPGMPGEEVPRAFLTVLSGDKREPFKKGSGRLELAQKIASRDNPLTARVFVNRVWLNHFGAGLVRTPSDFGLRTEPPINPELLDYLAARFMDEGWSIKKLHRIIMLSAAYQQSSDDNTQARAADPENSLLWRMNRRRLDFESTRDSLLAAAGQIDLAIGGRPVDITTQPFTHRRTVYAFVDRQNLPNLFRSFDFASPDTHSPMRFSTTVPQQALFMMNSPFVVEQTRALLNRPEIAKEKDYDARIQKMYSLLFGRAATSAEVKLGLDFMKTVENASPSEEPGPASAAWQYGYGEYDPAANKVKSFTPLPHFTGDAWQGGAKLPDPKTGWALLTGSGGHPGEAKFSAIRRWTAPRDGFVSVKGTLGHKSKDGDGVLSRVVSSRLGQQGWWQIHNGEVNTPVDRIEVKKGDVIDFVAECRKEVSFDSFTWAPVVRMLDYTAPAGSGEVVEWNATADFSGPAGKKPAKLTPWEKYTQVLLETNEFVFVD